MHADDVGDRHQRRERLHAAEADGELGAGGQIGVVEGDLHAEGARAQRRGEADAAETDDAEDRAAQAPHRGAAAEAPAADGSAREPRPGRSRCRGASASISAMAWSATSRRAVVGHVADRHAARAPGREVDIVEADAGAHDDRQLRELLRAAPDIGSAEHEMMPSALATPGGIGVAGAARAATESCAGPPVAREPALQHRLVVVAEMVETAGRFMLTGLTTPIAAPS